MAQKKSFPPAKNSTGKDIGEGIKAAKPVDKKSGKK